MRRPAPFTLFPALLPLLAAACGHSPATTFLAIDPVPPAGPAATAAYRGPPVRVPFLRVPVTLDRPEFAQQAGGTVAVAEFTRWAAPLGLLARNALIQDLAARLPAGAVLPPDAAAGAPEVRAEATVLAFRAGGGEATIDVSYRLVRPAHAGRATPPAAPRPATLRTPLAADTPAAQAQAWGALVGQLADRIAAELVTGREP